MTTANSDSCRADSSHETGIILVAALAQQKTNHDICPCNHARKLFTFMMVLEKLLGDLWHLSFLSSSYILWPLNLRVVTHYVASSSSHLEHAPSCDYTFNLSFSGSLAWDMRVLCLYFKILQCFLFLHSLSLTFHPFTFVLFFHIVLWWLFLLKSLY